jgi:hypothetical protein
MVPISNWTTGFLAFRERASELRGWFYSDDARWPATTGADVLAIVALVDPVIHEIAIDAGVEHRWDVALDDFARLGLGAVDATYLENEPFWSTLAAVCVYLDSIAAPMPIARAWHVVIDQLGELALAAGVRNAGADSPFHTFDAKTYDQLWVMQRDFLAEQRGSDKLDPPPGLGMTMKVPRTTNADVLQLAAYWTHELESIRQLHNYDGVRARWQVALDDVDKLATPGKPDDVYAKNNEFWHEMWRVAVQVAVTDEAPTKWQMFVEFVKDTVKAIPGDIADAFSSVGHGAEELAGAGAQALGTIGNKAARGLFSGFGVPLLLGAGVVGYFLLRSHGGEHGEAT